MRHMHQRLDAVSFWRKLEQAPLRRGKADEIDPPPADGVTSSDRADKARSAGLWSTGQRIVSVGSKWITIPIALGVLGPGRYGAWLAVVSLVAWVAWSDMGIPAALTYPFATSIHTGDVAMGRKQLGAGLTILTLVAVALWIILIPLVVAGHAASVLGASIGPFRSEVDLTLGVVGTLALVGLPLRLVDSITLALQRVKWLAITDIVAAVVSLAAVLVWRQAQGSLPELAVATMLPATVGRALLWCMLARTKQGMGSPALSTLQWGDVAPLIRRGSNFLVGTAAEMVTTQTPILFLSRSLGVDAVPGFVIPFQVFSTAMQGVVALLWPMWGAYSEASVKQEWDWIRHAHRQVIRQTVLLSVSGFGVLALLTPVLIAAWVGAAFAPDRLMLLQLWVLFSVWAWCHAWNILATGLDFVRLRTVALIALGLVTLTATPLTIHALGANGAPTGLLIALLTTQAWILPLWARRSTRRRIAEGG